MARRNPRALEDIAAMDAALGKVRRDVLDRPRLPIRRGELVRVRGIGIGRKLRFRDFVFREDGRSYVTVVDSAERRGTGGFYAVRPDQVSRVRRQR